VTWRLKDGTEEPEGTVVARQRLCKHVPEAVNTHVASKIFCLYDVCIRGGP
jgi:hypothetical protein